MNEEQIRQKLENGWIKSRIYIEVMATNEKVTEQAMKDHVNKLRDVEGSMILNEKYETIQKVENPMREIKEAYSQVVQLELLTKDLSTLLFIVIFYAPSAIEILEPNDLKIGIEQVQTIMNSVADLVHRFAASGAGGVVISTQQKPQA